MKQLLLLPAFLIWAWGCTGHKQSSEPAHEHDTAPTVQASSGDDHASGSHALTLNNGQKWRIDEPTRRNIKGLQSTVAEAASQSPVNYHDLAASLQAGTDKLVQECKMTGPDHDALHVWLQGYLPALKGLHSTDKAGQQAAFTTLRHELDRFNEYFE